MTQFVENTANYGATQPTSNNTTFPQPQRGLVGRILDRAPMWLLVIIAAITAAQIVLPENYTPAYLWGRVDGTTESGSHDASRKSRVSTEDALQDVQTAYQIKLQSEVIKMAEEKDIAVARATAEVQKEKDIAIALNQEAAQRARERQQAINEAQQLAQKERLRQVEATSSVKTLGILVGDTACELRGFLGSDFGGCDYAEAKRDELQGMADGSLDTYENDAPADGADIVDPSQVVIGEELEQSHGRYRNAPESDTSATQADDDGE